MKTTIWSDAPRHPFAALCGLLLLLSAAAPSTLQAVDELGIFELEGNPQNSTDGSHLDNGRTDAVDILNGDPTGEFKFVLFGTDDIDESPHTNDKETSIYKTGNAIKDDALISTWGWKIGDPSPKVDIQNAWAGTTVYQGPTVRATAPAVAPNTLISIPGEGTFSAEEGASGSVVTGLVDFTPEVGFTGESSITYSVCDDPGPGNSGEVKCDSALLTVVVAADPAGNVAPQANDDLVKTEVSVVTDILVLRNDIDLDGDTLTLHSIDTTGTLGSPVTIVGNTVQYTAPATFATDSFSYTVCDGPTGPGTDLCDTATVTIEVDIDDDNRVSATSDYVLIRPGASLTDYDVLLNDTDPEPFADDFDFDVVVQGAYSAGLLPWDGEHRQGDAILYFGLDVRNEDGGNVGDSSHSFWFLQDENVAPDNEFPAATSGDWFGAHRRYDLLIQTNVGGSGTSSASAFVWDPPNGPSSYTALVPIADGNDCVGANAITCTTASRIDTPVPTSWPHFDIPDGPIFQPSKYIEGGLNLSLQFRKLGVPVPCFSVMNAETRNSDSVTATLVDYLNNGFESCSFRIEKTGDDVVVVGDIATYTITLENTGVLALSLVDMLDPLIDNGDPGNETTLKAARAAGCDVVPAGQSCSFQVSYQTSSSDPDPLPNTVTATMVSNDGTFFTQSDDHIIDLVSAASLGDTVWLDEDGNGVYDAGEDGLANVTVDLFADRTGDGTPDLQIAVVGNALDLNGGGVGTDDDGYWYGVRVIDGLLDLNGDGVIDTVGGTDSGSITVEGTTYTVTDGAIQTGDGALPGAWDQTQTDANGEYLFTQLPPNTYDVSITVPTGMDVTYDLDQGWAGGAGTPDGTTQATLVTGELNTDADFGLNWVPVTSTDGNTGTGAIGDRIWHDASNDGVQDEGEAGVAGVTIRLYEDDDGSGNFDGVYDTLVDTATTDADGRYIFDNLDPGAYVVEVDSGTLPGGLGPNPTPGGDPDGDGDNISNPIMLAPGDAYLNADWGYNGAGQPVSGTIYLDSDVTGELSVGDAGLFGITVNLVDSAGNVVATTTTDATGLYTFPAVIPGTYTVEVGDTAGALADDEQTGDPSAGQTGAVCTVCDGVGEITVVAAPINGVDFGYVPLEHESGQGLISGSVGLDALNPNDLVDGGEELAGIDVTLFQLYDIVNGKVDFDGDGNTSNDPDDTGAIYVDDDNDGVLEIYCVYLGFLDVNCDHSGVNVTGGLLDANNDGMVDSDDDGTYTDAAGKNYIIKDGYIDLNGDGVITDDDDSAIYGAVDGVTIIDGWFDVDNDFTDTVGTRDLSPGDAGDTTELDGDDAFSPAAGSLLDGYDVDDGLIYLDGTTTLVNGQLAPEIDSTTTDASGFYAFGSLDPNGEYRVALDSATYPADTTEDFDFGTGGVDGVSDDIDLGAAGGTQTGVDFGLIGNGLNSLSGTIWNDVNADGTLLGESVWFEGVTVALYDSSGRLVATTRTDSSGNYSFNGLADGDYTVKVTDEDRVLTGYWLSDGPNDFSDNNSQTDPYTVTLTSSGGVGEDDTTADFGYYIDPAIVGNTVFKDLNGDGVQQLADGETGFAGVQVVLTVSYPDGTDVTVVTNTDASGNYSFGNLLLDEDLNGLGAGEPTFTLSVSDTQAALVGYLTTEDQPNAVDDSTETLGCGVACDGDADTAAGTAAYPVQGGTDATNDFGFALPSALYASATGLVWLDVDHDGVWDVGEPGIDQVTVSLYADRTGNGTTDADVCVVGSALDLNCDGFVNSEDDGQWYGYEVINGLIDYNGDGLVAGDTGYPANSDDGSVTTVDGTTYTIDDGELPTAPATIDGAWEQTITDANGNYSFDELPPGDYQVQVSTSELGSGGDLEGLDETAGNDGSFDGFIGGTAGFNLTAGESEVITSLGYVPFNDTAVIEGNVFSDANTDGLFDLSEVGIGAVTVNLYDLSGNLVATTTTGPDGQYLFTGVLPGDYVVQVDLDDDDLQAFCGTADPTLADCETTATTSDPITVDIDDTVSGINFGFDNPAGTYTVTDTVFNDFNGDSDCEYVSPDCTEEGLAGVTVDLYDCGPDEICGNADDVGVIATVATDENGDFTFDGVPEGTYEMVITDVNGVLNDYYETTATDGVAEITVDDTTTGGDGVLNTVGDDGTGTFGYRKPGTISGSVYSDAADFGTFNEVEAGFGGVLVRLYDDLGNLVAETLTAADGSYNFEYLDPGSYRVEIDNSNFLANGPLDGSTQTGDPDLPGAQCTTCDDQTTALLVLNAGESIQDIDFGYNDPALSDISGTVFNDYNENAVHEPNGGDGDPGTTEDNETGIEGVTISLSPEFDIENGLIDLDGNPSTLDDGFISGSLDDVEVIDGRIDINGDGVTDEFDDGTFNGIDIVDGFFDVDGDGNVIVGGNENAGDDNGTVVLDPIATAVTDANGDYEFTDVPDGDYVVAVTDDENLLDGYTLTSGLDERDVTADSTLGDVTDIDFGYVTDSGTGRIGDTVFLDSDGDGVQDANEPGLAGVTVYLCEAPILPTNCNAGNATESAVTDADGNYLFDNLPAGDYELAVDATTVDSGLEPSSGFDYYPATINLSEGEAFLDADIGYKPNSGTAVVGDFVWNDVDGDGIQDAGEVGIPGVDVIIYDPVTDTTYVRTTDEFGNWLMTGLTAGRSYTVYVDGATLPDGFVDLPTNLGGGDTYVTPELVVDTALTTLDFGFTGGANGSIGDTVWLDANGDGIRQTTGPGAEAGLEGVPLRLMSPGPDGIQGTADDFRVASTTTDANGEYLFAGLQDGDYYVEIATNDPEINTLLAALDPTPTGLAGTHATNGETAVISLVDGELYDDADFGFVPNAGTALIGDFIWSDADGDGVQDAGEVGVEGVTVYLCLQTAPSCDAANAEQTVVTDSDGSYLFTNVVPGDYTVTVDSGTVTGTNTGDPDEAVPNPVPGTCAGCDGTTDLTVAAGDVYDDADFGYYDPATGSGSIGDTIYLDANGDGSQGAGEPGIDGVTLNLWTVGIVGGGIDLNGDGIIDGNDSGWYAGYQVFDGKLDTDNDGDADGDDSTTVNSVTVNGYNVINGLLDLNADTLIDIEDSLPAELVATTETAGGGLYTFSGLSDGDYRVEVSDNGNALDGMTETQAAPQDLTIDCSTSCNAIDDADFGYAPSTTVGAITGSIWWDDDDGTREAGEAPISGVQVDLKDANGNVIATTFTDSDGNYVFPGLPAGDYTVDVVESTLPPGYAASNDTDGTGSGPNASAGETGTITVVGGETYDEDFAYVPQAGTAIIGDTVWSDDGDGVQEAGEVGIGGVTVDLYDLGADGALGGGDDTLIASTITAADGSYEFNVPATGTEDYAVIVDDTTLPAGYGTTPTNNSGSDTHTFSNVTSGSVYDTADWGFDLANDSSISGTLYADGDADATQDLGEAGFPAVPVSLLQEFLVVDGRVDLDRSGSGVGDNGFIDGVQVIDGRLDIDGDGVITEADDGTFNGNPVIDGFIDLNGNNVDDPGSLAAAGDSADDGALLVTVGTTVTDANGDYVFDNLPAGEYLVEVSDTGGALNGLYETEIEGPISLPAATDYTDADFGFAPGADSGSIGDFVYFDANGDGDCDPVNGVCTEAGISGVTLDLVEPGPDGLFGTSDDVVVDTTTTASDGSYLFNGVDAGLYQVVVTDLNNVVGDLLPTEIADSPILVSCDTTCTDVTDADFGYEPTVGDVGNIGGTVWHDTIRPSSEIGTLQTDESGIAGVEVELWLDVDGDGIVTPGIDNLVRTTLTDANGDYNFLGVPVDDYIVVVPDDTTGDVAGNLGTNDPLAGMQSVLGPNPDLDSNGHQNSYPVTLTAGETNTTVDFAYEAVVGYDITGVVYEDANGDGSPFASGEDALAEGATMSLFRVVDGVPVLVSTTTTDNNGYYEFLDQPGGFEYIVEADTAGTVVDGLDQTVDYDEPYGGGDDPCVTCDGQANIDLLTCFGPPDSCANVNDVNFAYWNGGVITTPVTLSYFEAQPGDEAGEVHFSWATSTEAGNVGFDLYVKSDGGPWRRINEQMIPTQPGLPTERRSYSYYARNVQGDEFYIVDIDMFTDEVEHGPFRLGSVYGQKHRASNPVPWEAIREQHRGKSEQHKERKKEKMKQKLKNQKQKLKDKGRWSGDAQAEAKAGWASRLAGGVLSLLVGSAHAADLPVTDTGLQQIQTTQAGLHRISYEDLAAAGLDVNGVDPDVIGLTHEGEPVALRVYKQGKGGKKSFGPGWYIEFVADARNTLYSKTNVYNLYLDEVQAARMSSDNSKVNRNDAPDSYYMESVRVEDEFFYNSASPTADPWYMNALNAFAYLETDFDLVLDEYAGPLAPATLEVGLWGGINWPDGGDDHHVLVSFNGELVADRWFDGVIEEFVSEPVPASAEIVDGLNTVTVTVPMDTGFFVDFVNLNHYALTYPRNFVAHEGSRLQFSGSGTVYEVSGLAEENVVIVRRRTSGDLEVVTNTEVSVGEGGTYTVRFNGIQGELCDYFVYTENSLVQPTLEPPAEDSDITSNPAQYLVIAHPDFIGPDSNGFDPLAELVLARQGDGYTVQVVDIEQVYAQFGYGMIDPASIHEYVKFAASNMGTELVLLVGGDTYDYHDYLQLNAVSFVPSLYAATGPFTKHAPVDPMFTDIDGDDVPDLAIGRFPVRTHAELKQIVDKTLAWEVRDYELTSLFAADGFDAGQNYDFKSDSEDMLSRLPAGWQANAVRAYVDDLGASAAGQLIIDTINNPNPPATSAVALTSYVGHSGPTEWTFDGLFNSADAAGLTNMLEPTIVTQWGCWNTYYVEPMENTLAHEFLLNGEQGAAAVLGASTLTEAQHERELAKKLYEQLFQPGITLGEAVLQAKKNYVASAPADADVILGWTLLGDPALVLAE